MTFIHSPCQVSVRFLEKLANPINAKSFYFESILLVYNQLLVVCYSADLHQLFMFYVGNYLLSIVLEWFKGTLCTLNREVLGARHLGKPSV